MHWIDWVILTVPVLIVSAVTLYARRFMRGAADFLTGGRVAGRYVVCVASGEASLGLLAVVAGWEIFYKSGAAFYWWGNLMIPLWTLVTLSGFCVYRFRETRAMTMGQFLEVRYSRKLRTFTAILQTLSGLLVFGLFPAVGARFFVYFLDLPLEVTAFGLAWPTFALLMAFFLGIAVLIANFGGQIAIMTSDCVMGILSYPMYLVIVVAVLAVLSWPQEMAPALLMRAPGESMVNPFDIANLRDFNLFYMAAINLLGLYGMMSGTGTQAYNAAARNAHEQKMGRVLSVWRAGFGVLMAVLLGVAGYTYYHHDNHREAREATMSALSQKALAEFGGIKGEVAEENGLSATEQTAGLDPSSLDPATALKHKTIVNQLMIPMAIRDMLPVGVLGIFCAIMLFLMISTDTTYLHSYGSIIVQDLILPLRKKPFSPGAHILWLRFFIILVAVFVFLFSLHYGQVTYIAMFTTLVGSIYAGGAGAVIIGGLYWSRGTTVGAWAALLTGAGLAGTGFFLTQHWAGTVYPMLTSSPAVLTALSNSVHTFSSLFEPIILWRVVPEKFFMNGVEISMATVTGALSAYIIGSLLTCKEPFNMDRMLHRGDYRRSDSPPVDAPPLFEKGRSVKSILLALMGIDGNFTRGDKILAGSVLVWSLGWSFGSVVVIVLWNLVAPWTETMWVHWFFISNFIIAGIIGLVSTVWFFWGGTRDLLRMFRDLKNHKSNPLDDGTVHGHQNADDLEISRKTSSSNQPDQP